MLTMFSRFTCCGSRLIRKTLLAPLLFCLLYAFPVHAGTISHERHETAAHAFYASLPAGYRLTEREKVEVLRLAGWDEAVIPEAVQVVNCESWYGVVDTLGDGGLAQGFFQVHWQFWSEWAEYDGDPFNPLHNATLALMIYERDVVLYRGDGWRQWSCKPS